MSTPAEVRPPQEYADQLYHWIKVGAGKYQPMQWCIDVWLTFVNIGEFTPAALAEKGYQYCGPCDPPSKIFTDSVPWRRNASVEFALIAYMDIDNEMKLRVDQVTPGSETMIITKPLPMSKCWPDMAHYLWPYVVHSADEPYAFVTVVFDGEDIVRIDPGKVHWHIRRHEIRFGTLRQPLVFDRIKKLSELDALRKREMEDFSQVCATNSPDDIEWELVEPGLMVVKGTLFKVFYHPQEYKFAVLHGNSLVGDDFVTTLEEAKTIALQAIHDRRAMGYPVEETSSE